MKYLYRIERYLLLNTPIIWYSMFIRVFCFSCFFFVVQIGFVLLFPLGKNNVPLINSFFQMFFMISAVVSVLWLFYISFYKPRNCIFENKWYGGFVFLSLIYIGLVVINVTPIISLLIISKRIQNVVLLNILKEDYVKALIIDNIYETSLNNDNSKSILYKDINYYAMLETFFQEIDEERLRVIEDMYSELSEEEISRIADRGKELAEYIDGFFKFTRDHSIEESKNSFANIFELDFAPHLSWSPDFENRFDVFSISDLLATLDYSNNVTYEDYALYKDYFEKFKNTINNRLYNILFSLNNQISTKDWELKVDGGNNIENTSIDEGFAKLWLLYKNVRINRAEGEWIKTGILNSPYSENEYINVLKDYGEFREASLIKMNYSGKNRLILQKAISTAIRNQSRIRRAWAYTQGNIVDFKIEKDSGSWRRNLICKDFIHIIFIVTFALGVLSYISINSNIRTVAIILLLLIIIDQYGILDVTIPYSYNRSISSFPDQNELLKSMYLEIIGYLVVYITSLFIFIVTKNISKYRYISKVLFLIFNIMTILLPFNVYFLYHILSNKETMGTHIIYLTTNGFYGLLYFIEGMAIVYLLLTFIIQPAFIRLKNLPK